VAKIRPLDLQQAETTPESLIQSNLQRFTQQLEENPLLSGRLIEGVVLLLAAPTAINHRLGRKPQGWHVVDIESGGVPTIARTVWDDKTITLTTTANCTVNLWVF